MKSSIPLATHLGFRWTTGFFFRHKLSNFSGPLVLPAQLVTPAGGEEQAALLTLLHVPGEHVLREVVPTDKRKLKFSENW
jgi:hypothetical protein